MYPRRNPRMAASILMALAASGMAMPAAAQYAVDHNDREPERKPDPYLQQEIAAWNAAVDQRRAEKKARKLSNLTSTVRKAHQ